MNVFKRCKPLLGTYVELSIAETASDRALMALSNRAFDAMAQIDRTMSFHKLDSELSRINRYAYQCPIDISSEMYQVLSLAIRLSHLTNGVYDITVAPKLVEQGLLPDHGWECDPMADWTAIELGEESILLHRRVVLDLGGIAKGFAVDKALEVLKDTNAVVNAGGDLKMSQWQNEKVFIRSPDKPTCAFKTVMMQAAAVATSGPYFLGTDKQAIMNPKQEYRTKQACNVSIFSASCMMADALTKVASLLPDAETALLPKLNATVLYH